MPVFNQSRENRERGKSTSGSVPWRAARTNLGDGGGGTKTLTPKLFLPPFHPIFSGGHIRLRLCKKRRKQKKMGSSLGQLDNSSSLRSFCMLPAMIRTPSCTILQQCVSAWVHFTGGQVMSSACCSASKDPRTEKHDWHLVL